MCDAGCLDNKLFWNNISDGEHGIYAHSCGFNNNISYNGIDGSDVGIHLEFTLWSSLFENNFEGTSDTGCLIESSHFTRIKGGSSNSTSYGYYLDSSMNSVLAMVSIGNASTTAITLYDLFNIRVVIISINFCTNGLNVYGGNLIQLRELTMDNCDIGIFCTMYPDNIYLYNEF